MFSQEYNEMCDRILNAIESGKDFVIGKDIANELFIAVGNDATKIENWNKWIQLKYPEKASPLTFEQCMMCDGEGEIKAVYGGTAYALGYSDHGHTFWEKCEYCQYGINLVIENAKNIGAYE